MRLNEITRRALANIVARAFGIYDGDIVVEIQAKVYYE